MKKTLAALLLGTLVAVDAAAESPRLVVIIVVDQLRADGLKPVLGRLLPPGTPKAPGGFRYLLERGAYWPLAEYGIAQCMTGPGHATISTGTYPYRHGITTNSWWTGDETPGSVPPESRRDARSVECVSPLETAPELGESPMRLRAPTLGDSLREVDPRSRVVGVALKARSAILLGGHSADLAIWFDEAARAWRTSGYYERRSRLPSSVVALNGTLKEVQPASLRLADGGPWTSHVKPLPEPLPRRIATPDPMTIATSDQAAVLTTDVAIALLEDPTLQLGQDGSPDVLAISFSGHDLLAHSFGPQSAAVFASTLAEDREVARLLRAVAKRVPGGLGATLVAFTADHGGPAVPEDLAALGQPTRVVDTTVLRERLSAHLDRIFPSMSQGRPWTAAWSSSSLWLNPAVVSPESERWAEVLAEAKRYVLKNFADVYADASTQTERAVGIWPPGILGAQARNTVVLGRSGHIIFYSRPGVFDEKQGDLVSHMTGYTYDRMVPLVLAGPGIVPGVRASPVEIVDVTPTLAFLLGVLPPAAATGRVLHEAIDPASSQWTRP